MMDIKYSIVSGMLFMTNQPNNWNKIERIVLIPDSDLVILQYFQCSWENVLIFTEQKLVFTNFLNDI